MSRVQIDRETAQTLLNLTIRLEYFAEANRLRAALAAPQTTEAIDPDKSRCAIPPERPDPREERDRWRGLMEARIRETGGLVLADWGSYR